MSQISGPRCDSDIEPDQFKSFVWESHVRQQIFVVLEDFYCQKKQNPAWFWWHISYQKITIVCRDNIKHGKNCTDEWLDFLCGVITEGKIMLQAVY